MAADNDNVVIAAFNDPEDAKSAVEALHDAGFDDHEIGVLRQDGAGRAEVKPLEQAKGKQAGTGAAVGAAVGLGLGVVAGFLPGIGPILASGILASILAIAATGAAAGGIVGALVGMGISEDDAHFFDHQFREGRTIVLVVSGDQTDLAFRVFHHHNAAYRPETTGGAERETGAAPPLH
jgi:hypothetical protein